MAFNNPAIIVDTYLDHAADAPDWSTPGDLALSSPAGVILHAIHWSQGECEFIGKAELFLAEMPEATDPVMAGVEFQERCEGIAYELGGGDFVAPAARLVDYLAGRASREVRRTTYRFGVGSNTVAIDLGGNPGMVVESCLIHDWPDKAVSIAAFSHGTLVTNCLLYRNGIGISAYAASNGVFLHNTIADSTTGLLLRERNLGEGAGHAAGTNNIVWGNTENVVLTNGAGWS